MYRTECAEFPNDNPDLHDGAIWICTRTVGAPIVVRPDSRADSPPVEELRAEALAEPAHWLDQPEEPMLVAEVSPPDAPLSFPVAHLERPQEESEVTSQPFSALIMDSLTNGNVTDIESSPLDDEPTEELIFSALEGAHEAVAEEIPEVRELDRVAPLASGFFAVGSVALEDDEGEADFLVEELPPLLEEADEHQKVSEQLSAQAETSPAEAPEPEELLAEAPAAILSSEEDRPEIVVDPVAAPVATIHDEPEAEQPSGTDDPFETLIQAISNVALQRGSLVEAAAARNLLTGACVEGLSAERMNALRAGEIVSASGKASAKISMVADGWCKILRGESEDWSAVGASSLDEWAAEILSRLLENSPVSQLRKELREQGVAAFGLASAA